MTLNELQQKLKDRVSESARELFDVELNEPNAETPPRPELGDLAFPVCFELAKLIKQKTGEKQNPRAIAEKLKPELERIDEVYRVDIAGAGYINVFFNRAKLLSIFTARASQPQSWGLSGPKMMVEHTSINPNKAAHIGHVRNAVLGDTFARILKYSGNRVQIQNYIDNTGVQVADVVIGFLQMEKRSPIGVMQLAREPKFDYYCWDLYAKATQLLAHDK